MASTKASKFDLNLLPIAVALLQARSVTKAADKLGMSQPAVSSALRKLRTVFGDQLFVKSARGIEPTPRALVLIPAAGLILSRVEQDLFSELSFDPFKYKDSFTLGLTEIGELLYLPLIIKNLKRLAPQATVRSVSVPRREISQELRNGKVDLVIGAYPGLHDKNIHQQRLYPGEFACLVRAGHPIRRGRLSLEDLLSLDHVIVQSQAQPPMGIFEQLEARKITRAKITLITSNWLCIPRIVATSDLAALMPLHLAVHYYRSMPNLRIVALPAGIPSFLVAQCWHSRFEDDPKNKWLRTLLWQLLSGGWGSSVKLMTGLRPSPKKADSTSIPPVRVHVKNENRANEHGNPNEW